MPDHRARMAAIGRFALPSAGTASRAALDRVLNKLREDPQLDRDVRKQWNRARALVIAQQDNGTDLQVDATLRYFHAEFNNRTIRHGLQHMPMSFNVLEAFHQYLPEMSVFRLRRQIDYVFSVPDFLDRVTLNELPLSLNEAASYFEEGVIYNFENAVDPADLEFSIRDGAKVGIAGFSVVKHGNEISALLLGGEEADLGKASESLQNNLTLQPIPGKEAIGPAPDFKRQAVPLPSKRHLWKTLALTRFDLDSVSQHVRYVMRDCGDCYMSITNDPDCFLNEHGEFIDPSCEDTLKETSERIRTYEVLFELCSTFLYLPVYFEKFGDLATEERRKTRYGDNAGKLSYGSIRKQCPGEEKLAFRHLTVLSSTGEHFESSWSFFRAPPFRVEKSGYWRRLPPGTVGSDRQGQPVHGRTWVQKRLSWVEDEFLDAITLTRLSQRQDPQLLRTGPDPGRIYVMRSAGHPRNIFKIGSTRRRSEERAEELSQASGILDGFFVIHDWYVLNCSEAESRIHALLEPYRVNPKREFFDLPLKEIVRVIEAVVLELNGGMNG